MKRRCKGLFFIHACLIVESLSVFCVLHSGMPYYLQNQDNTEEVEVQAALCGMRAALLNSL